MTCPQYIYAASVTIVSGVNDGIQCDLGSGTVTRTIAAGTYYLYGDGTEAGDLCKAIADALAGGATCSYTGDVGDGNQTGAVTLDSNTGTLILYAGTTFDLGLIGHETGTLTGGSGSGLSPNATWTSVFPPIRNEPVRDTPKGTKHSAPNNAPHVFISGDNQAQWSFEFANEPGERVWMRTAIANTSPDDPDRAFQSFHRYARSRKVRVFEVDISSGTSLATATDADKIVTISPELEAFEAEETLSNRDDWSWSFSGGEV